jgi:hypothetical protein
VSNFKWGIIAGAAALLISISLGVVSGVNASHIILRALIFLVVFFGLGIGLRVLVNNYFPELLYMDGEPAPQLAFEQPGSHINITLDNISEYAVPEKYRGQGDPQELGNIEDLISGTFSPFSAKSTASRKASGAVHQEGIDRKREDDYNIQSGLSQRTQSVSDQDNFQFPEISSSGGPVQSKPVFTPNFGDGSDDLGGLPDLESMAMAFSSGFESEPGVPTAMPSAASSLPVMSAAPVDVVSFEEMESAEQQYNKGNKPQQLKGDFNPKELAEGIRTVLSKDR